MNRAPTKKFSLRSFRSLREIFRDKPVREAHPAKTFVNFVPFVVKIF